MRTCGPTPWGSGRAKGRRRSSAEPRRPFALRARPAGAGRGLLLYLTVTVLTAEVFDVPEYVTRTRILYLPFFAGAFHLSE